jgi:hypothetical protein
VTVLRVASVPAAHPYVRSIIDTKSITVLDDPIPPTATAPGQWWPPQLLEPDYLRHQLEPVDLLHVHFGFDAIAVETLAEVLDILARRRVPLVVTVHDLHNPHFIDQSAHAERLDLLLPAADAVITLTNAAAADIGRRWGRDAVVIPHPNVLPLERIGARRPAREVPVVGLHAKNLRANVDPWPLLDRLTGHDRSEWSVRLDFDDSVLNGPRAGEAGTDRLDRYRQAGVDVRLHARFTDSSMADYLTEVDVLVLPYRHGTHSGWVEASYDAGVQAVVPDCGHFHDQHGDLVFGYGTGYFDTESFDQAILTAVRRVQESPVTPDPQRRLQREKQRRHVQRATYELYRRVLSSQVCP